MRRCLTTEADRAVTREQGNGAAALVMARLVARLWNEAGPAVHAAGDPQRVFSFGSGTVVG